MLDGFLRLRPNEGAMKARVKNDTSAENWPMNAQFFPSSFVTLSRDQAPVVQKLDNAIHWINHYPADGVIDFRNTYPLNSNLSGG